MQMKSSINLNQPMIIELSGYITAANINELQEKLKAMILDSSDSSLLVDMARVEFLDSAGLMTLASNFRLAQNLGKNLGICSIPPSVKIIFELTQLDRVLEIYESRKEYEAALKANYPEIAA